MRDLGIEVRGEDENVAAACPTADARIEGISDLLDRDLFDFPLRRVGGVLQQAATLL